jgi:hypothetical protein
MTRPDALRVLFTEYGKYVLALARGLLPQRPVDEAGVLNASATAAN